MLFTEIGKFGEKTTQIVQTGVKEWIGINFILATYQKSKKRGIQLYCKGTDFVVIALVYVISSLTGEKRKKQIRATKLGTKCMLESVPGFRPKSRKFRTWLGRSFCK